MRNTAVSRLRWWLIRLVILGVVVAGLALAASLALRAYGPALSRDRLEAALTAALGRPVRIGEATLSLWRGRIEITGLRVEPGPGEGTEPVLQVGRGRLQVGISSLWRRQLVLSTIRLEDLTLRLSATGQAASSPSPPLDVPDTLQAGPVTVRIGTVRIERGHIIYSDDARGLSVEVRGLDATGRPMRRGIDATLHLAALSLQTSDLRETVTDVEGSGWIHQDLLTIRKLAGRWQARSLRVAGDVRHPFASAETDLRVQGEVDLAPLAQRLKAPWPLTGVATVDAGIRGPVDAVQVAGRLAVPQLTAGPIQARDIAIRGQGSQTEVDLAQVTARIFGGTLRGSLKTKPDRLEDTRANFVLQRASLPSLDALAPTPVGLRGELDVEAEVAGDPRRLEALHGRFRLTATQVTPPGELQRIGAGTLSAAGTFRDAIVEVAQASGRWPGLQFEASGRLDPQGPRGLRLALDGDLGTLAPLWGALGVAGQATLKGEANGPWTDPAFAGEVRAAPVTVAGVKLDTLRAPVRLGRTTLAMDSATASLGRSRATASGTLTWGDIAGSGGPKVERRLRFRADVLASTVQWEDLHPWLPQAAQGTGRVAVTGHVEGTPDAWRGEGTIEGSALTAHDVPIRDLQGVFRLTQNQVELSRVRAQAYGISVHGTGVWGWDGTGQAAAEVGPADLAALPGVPTALGLLGTGQAQVQVAVRSGTVEASGTAALQRVSISEVVLGNGAGHFVLSGGQWQADLTLPETRLSATARGSLDGDRPAAVRVDAREVALAPLLARIEKLRDLTVDGTLTAGAELLVPLSQPSAAHGTLTLESARLLVAGEEWTNRGAATFRWETSILTIDGLHFTSRLGDLKASGRVDPSGPISLQVDGRVPLTILPALRPEIREAAGTLAIAGRIGGTVAAPRLGGEAAIRGGTFQFRDRPETLREVEARILFSPEGVRVAEATGSLGRGRIRASGDLTLDGWRPGAYRIAARGTNVSLAPFEGLQTAWDLDLELVGQGPRTLLRGEGRLLQGRYTGQLNLVSMLLSRQREKAAGDSFALPLRLLLKLDNNLRVDTNWARLQVGGRLSLEGTTAEPILLGSLESQEGRIVFRKQRWTVTSASVRFADPRRIEPILDLTGRAQIKDYDVTLRLSGRPDELTFRFSSVPTLSQQEILSLVTLGVTARQAGRSPGGVVAGELAQLLAEDVLGQATSGYAPETLELEKTDKNQQVFHVGKQVTEDVRVLYSQTVSGTSKQVVRLEYQVIGPLLLSAEQDFQGGFGGDVLIRLRFR
jgi:translocation and assembly module TamB